jgi:predicted methyltransferase
MRFGACTPRFLSFCWVLATLVACPARSAAQNRGPKRDAWQRPQEVMDELGIKPGSAVADVGCGAGYFSFLLARRVGPQGKVYAEDVNEERLEEVRRHAREQALTQVETVAGAADDPRLPASSVDVVLIVDAYHEMRHYDAMLAGIYRSMKPGGLLALIDGVAVPGRPRREYYDRHRMPEEIERQDVERHGFQFIRKPSGFTRSDDGKQFYFLIFKKPEQNRT